MACGCCCCGRNKACNASCQVIYATGKARLKTQAEMPTETGIQTQTQTQTETEIQTQTPAGAETRRT